jgi:hypothetical protein
MDMYQRHCADDHFPQQLGGKLMQHLTATGRPVVLTVNGKAAVVVQDA